MGALAVNVAGIDVTQEMLDRAIGIIADAKPTIWDGEPVSRGYRPSLGNLGPHDGEGEPKPEQVLYSMLQRQDSKGSLFRAFVKARQREPEAQPQRETPRETPTQTLTAAGFPRVVAVRAGGEAPHRLGAWAGEYRGIGTPWAWIVSRDPTAGAEELARAALKARARVPRTKILYADAYDVCGKVDAAKRYDSGNKWETMRGYAVCDLLALGNLGGERPTDHTLDTLARIVRKRHDYMLPTVITAAVGLREWLDPYMRIDQAKARGMGRCIVGALGGWETDEAAARKRLESNVVNLDK